VVLVVLSSMYDTSYKCHVSGELSSVDTITQICARIWSSVGDRPTAQARLAWSMCKPSAA
jgi:hypothetical protein